MLKTLKKKEMGPIKNLKAFPKERKAKKNPPRFSVSLKICFL